MKFLVIGHVTFDIIDGQKVLGGPPNYQLPILLNEGYEVDLVTSATKDYPLIQHPRLTIYNIETDFPTIFSFEFLDQARNNRRLRLLSKAAPLSIPDEIFKRTYDAVITTPICNEITLKEVKRLKPTTSLLVCDIQGFVRSIGPDGSITHKKNLPWNELLETFDIIKASQEELEMLPKGTWKSMLIRTHGDKPTEVYYGDQRLEFKPPQIDPSEIVDATGSGDIFLVSFTMKYLKDRSIDLAMRYAQQIVIEQLKQKGPPKLLSEP